LKWILCIGPSYSVFHLPFQSDCLSNFEFFTSLCLMVFKNLIYELKMIKNFTQLTNMVHIDSSLCYQKGCSHSFFPWITLKLIYAKTIVSLNGCKKTLFFFFLIIAILALNLFHLVRCFFKVCHWTKLGLGG